MPVTINRTELQKGLVKNGYTLTGTARKAHVSYLPLARAVKHGTPLKESILKKVADALNVNPLDLAIIDDDKKGGTA